MEIEEIQDVSFKDMTSEEDLKDFSPADPEELLEGLLEEE